MLLILEPNLEEQELKVMFPGVVEISHHSK